jgi:hypothetical protein
VTRYRPGASGNVGFSMMRPCSSSHQSLLSNLQFEERRHRPRSNAHSVSVAHLEDPDPHATVPTFVHCSQTSPSDRPMPR